MALGGAGRGRSRDFGFSGNLTLPLSVNREECTSTGKIFMPDEEKGRTRKKHTRFPVGNKPTERAEKVEEDGSRPKKGQPMAGFIRGFFQRRRKKRKSPYQEDASMDTVSSGHRRGGKGAIRRLESEPQISSILQSEDEGESEGEEEQEEGAASFTWKDKTPSKTKAASTMFKCTNPSALSYQKAEPVVTTLICLTLKRNDSHPGLHRVTLEHREDVDSLGLYLSGGLPPVTVTHIEPGGQSEKAGIKVGDILLDVNGLNCQERVQLAQLMQLKMVVKKSADKQDEATRDKIKSRPHNFDSEEESDVQLKVTSIDSSDELELTTPLLARKVKYKEGKNERPKRQSAEIGSPLATSSPIKEDDTRIKKRESSSSLAATEEEDVCEGKRASKKMMTEKSVSTEVEGSREMDPDKNKTKKKTSKTKVNISVLVESTHVEVTSGKEEQKTIETSASGEEMSTFQEEEERNLKRSDRNKRSVSPKRRYYTDRADTVTGEESIDGRVVTEKSYEDIEKRRKMESKAAEKKVERKVKVVCQEVLAEPMEGVKDEALLLPAAVTGSFKSDIIEDVSKKSSRVSLKRENKDDLSTSSMKRERNEYLRTNSLKTENEKEDKVRSESKSTISSRRSSFDQFILESTERPIEYSQSFSTAKMQNRFRENLRQASKSEHNMADKVSSLDSNIKVKKSGQVKEGRSQARPSIFNHSSSTEPDEGSAWNLEAMGGWESIEDENLLDGNFKVKKSGVLVRKKAAVTTRPSILEDQPSSTDSQQGEMIYNREVEMDLSYMPHIMPSLGLMAGRDRRDASNRSLTKRRPPSLRLKATTPEQNGKPGTWRTAATRELFEKPNQKDDSKWIFNAHPVAKGMDKALKMPSISSKSKPTPNAAQVEENHPSYPRHAPANIQSMVISAPAKQSLVVLAPVQHEGACAMKTTPKLSTSTTTSTFMGSSKDSSIPARGHVAECLAMFQNR